MAISSNTLFHFTNEFKYLKQSLENGLWSRYNIERGWAGKKLAIPMLCFCDIPLSQIKNHIQDYGKYGIGVSKDFAREKKITPVLYLSQDSFLLNKINYFLNYYQKPGIDHHKMDIEEFMLYYVKRVTGKDFGMIDYKFYNEREWRYIPEITQDIHLEILSDNDDEDSIINEYCERTSNKRIVLKAKDISYIIVNKENEVDDVMKCLGKRFSDQRELNRLY
jgi:hypothetical protein